MKILVNWETAGVSLKKNQIHLKKTTEDKEGSF